MSGISFLVFAVVITVCQAGGHSSGWSYSGNNGPKYWYKTYPTCGGNVQSPIDIDPNRATQDATLSITLGGYDAAPSGGKATLKNNGHAAQVDLQDYGATISGSGLPEKYVAAQFHFHWGRTSSEGSEHTLAGKRYPIEMHIVHYRQSLGSVHGAMDKAKGLAVLGCLFEVTEKDNPAFNVFLEKFSKIAYKDTSVPVATFSLGSLLPTVRSRFYRYQGSLTTPACFESIIWTVFHDKCTISENQLNKFRNLYATVMGSQHPLKLVNNYRPIQQENGRAIYASFNTENVSSGSRSRCWSQTLLKTHALMALVYYWLWARV